MRISLSLSWGCPIREVAQLHAGGIALVIIITAIVIIITTSIIHPELTRKLSLSSHFIKITFSFRKSVKSVFDKTLSLILSI